MNTADITDNKNSTENDLAFLIREPAEVYHHNAANYLSSHFLADFRKCPLLYHRKRCGLIPDEDRPAYLLGRAAHTVILERMDVFQQSFAVGGPINPKTGLRIRVFTSGAPRARRRSLNQQCPVRRSHPDSTRSAGCHLLRAHQTRWR